MQRLAAGFIVLCPAYSYYHFYGMYQNVHMPVAALQDAPVKTGGACSIRIFKWEDVLTWPSVNPITGIISTSISLKPGKSMYLFPAIDESRGFTEDQKEGPAGSFFSINVKGLAPGSNASNILSIQTMIHHQWGILVADRNGVTRLIGNEDGGAKLLTKYDAGDPTSSRKTELSFTWDHSLPAPVYTAQAFEIIIGGVTVTVGTLTLIMRFQVGAPGAPMTGVDTTLTNAGFANKNLLVLADGIALAVDDGSGDIDWTGLLNRHIEKEFAESTITFIGGVVTNEIIEIYAFS